MAREIYHGAGADGLLHRRLLGKSAKLLWLIHALDASTALASLAPRPPRPPPGGSCRRLDGHEAVIAYSEQVRRADRRKAPQPDRPGWPDRSQSA